MMELRIDDEFKALIPPLQLGEYKLLKASIQAEGCRDRLVVWAGHNILLDGHNRYEICQQLGLTFRVLEKSFDTREDAGIWICENQLGRRNLEPTDKIDLAECQAEFLRRKARANLVTSSGGSHPRPLQKAEKAEAVNVVKSVAAKSGYSTDTVSKNRVINEAIANGNAAPEVKEKLRKGETTINKEYKAIVQAEKKAEALAKVAAAVLEPSGKYHVQIVDPPWAYEKRKDEVEHRARLLYPSMQVNEIIAYAQTKILPFFHDDSILWLWTTNAFMRGAYEICDSIGMEVKTILTWAKDKMGVGDWLRGQTEHCLLAVRGKPMVTLTNQTTLLHGVVRQHSRKPDEFYSLVQSLCHGRMAEHFSRERRAGFDCIGAEVDKFEGLPELSSGQISGGQNCQVADDAGLDNSASVRD